MPPKVKITKNDIIETALSLVQKNGADSLNARSIAAALNCSTQPVFSNFSTMEELQEATRDAAFERYLGFIESEVKSGKYPQYKAFGMAYIRFARDEGELFKLLFMRDRDGEDQSGSVDFEASVDMIMTSLGVSLETAQLMHLEMWSCVHGIATMHATSFLRLEWELIGDMLTDVYQGIRARHLSGEGKK